MKVLEMNTALNEYSKKKATEIFQKGDELEVTITGVQPYGAFGVTIVDGVEYTTLIHRSIIKSGDTDVEPERHFKNGDKVKGIVRGFDQKGNMSFSTVDYFDLLPDYFETKAYNEEINEEAEKTYGFQQENSMTEEEVNLIYNQIKPTLENTLSVISAESEQLFKQLIKDVGVVEFCLSLGKIAPTFNVDPGLILGEMIQNDIRGCL